METFDYFGFAFLYIVAGLCAVMVLLKSYIDDKEKQAAAFVFWPILVVGGLLFVIYRSFIGLYKIIEELLT